MTGQQAAKSPSMAVFFFCYGAEKGCERGGGGLDKAEP
jgi:hypothetical protein